jgi:hypothetical protein
MNWIKHLVDALLPWLIKGVKYLWNNYKVTTAKAKAKLKSKKSSDAYSKAETDEDIKKEFDNRS